MDVPVPAQVLTSAICQKSHNMLPIV